MTPVAVLTPVIPHLALTPVHGPKLPICVQSLGSCALYFTTAGCSAVPPLLGLQPVGRSAVVISEQMESLYEYPSPSGPNCTTPLAFRFARLTPLHVHAAVSHAVGCCWAGGGGGGGASCALVQATSSRNADACTISRIDAHDLAISCSAGPRRAATTCNSWCNLWRALALARALTALARRLLR